MLAKISALKKLKRHQITWAITIVPYCTHTFRCRVKKVYGLEDAGRKLDR